MNDLVDRIAAGTATLLGIDEICSRIGVSRTTFDRWVRNGGGKVSGHTLLAGDSPHSLRKLVDQAENFTDGTIRFPPPDIRIGNSPKWEMETFKRWLRANATGNDLLR